MRIYISGKISGLEKEEYMEHFDNAERELKEAGYEPINPAKYNDMLPKSLTWEEYMGIDLTLLLRLCDGIYMLNNWELSKGAKIERDLAITSGKTVMYQSGGIEERKDHNE